MTNALSGSEAPSPMLFDAQCDSDPQGLALDDGHLQRSWAELADRTTRLARWIHELGARPGDRIATLMGNRAECVELMLASIQAGVWLTPINWHLSQEEVAYVVADSDARVLFTDPDYAALAQAVFDGPVVSTGDGFEAGLADASDTPFRAEDPAGGPMIYTSGTTGRPKGVQRHRPPSLGAAREGQRAYARNTGLDGPGPHLITGPCYHASPLMFAIYGQSTGAPILVMPRWDAGEALRLLQEREVGQTHLVPTMFVRLLDLPEDERARFSAPALHLVLHGAAPIARPVKERMIDWWGPILVEYWGSTESGVMTLANSKEWMEHPSTVGKMLPAFDLFAADDAGKRLPPGENGLLYARHKTTPHWFAYHGAPEKTAESFLDDYTFTIGDIGRVDEDGWVYLADRKSHMIISGGVNIYPAEVEAALQEHPAIADVAVFGIPDDEWGESVKAAVELMPGETASEALETAILDWARERIARYKVPRSIDFETTLPRHASGKLYVRKLRDPYWKDRERAI
ncbi:MAG: AMP-binding protein [Myxococcota bacterium]